MPLEITISQQGPGRVTVALAGRLDTQTAPQAEAALTPLLQPEIQRLTLDLKRLDYISSAGLRLLLVVRKAFADRPGALSLRHVQSPVLKAIQMAGLIPGDIAASERSADIFLDAVLRREAVKRHDVSD